MANSSGSLDRAFEELIQKVVESTMTSMRADLARMAEAAVKPAASAGAPSPASSITVSQVLEAIHAILAPSSQTDIMAGALKYSAKMAGGAAAAALFVRRGDSFSVWRSEGLSNEQAGRLKSISVAASSPGAFQEVCTAARSVCHPASAATWPTGFDTLASGAGDICLLPIVVAGKVVAAIAVAADGSQDAMAALEIVARVAGLSLETSSSRTAVQPAATFQPAAPVPTAVSESVSSPAVEPPAPSSPPRSGEGARGSFADMGASPANSELPPPPDLAALPEADQETHKKAHRFARVAVQDLLSYHKTKVAEGRNNRNLYDLLREDIEKTRENYQKKFASTPAASFDYLHYEMVAKLAGNDLEVLGRNYPGPVSV